MSTNPATPPEGDPPPPGTPWDGWAGAGIDPNYDPQQARQALGFWDALRNRDQRDYAVEQLVRGDLPQGMSWAQAQQILQDAAQPPDPWQGVVTPPGTDPNEMYYESQAPPIDPDALRKAMEAEMDRRFAERDQQQQQQRQQEAFEAEFARETERVAEKFGLSREEMPWLAAQANLLHPSMPYATTSQLVEAAGEAVNKQLMARLQALATQQETKPPAAPLPPGSVPSDQQVPQNAQDSNKAAEDFFRG